MVYEEFANRERYCLEEWQLLPSQLENGSRYRFYIVLWIEWEQDIAYRRGIGRVKSEAWEAHGLESIDLILG